MQPKDLQEQPEAERERRGRAAAAAAAMPHPTLQHATAEAVNLLLEDIDALAAENALLTVSYDTTKSKTIHNRPPEMQKAKRNLPQTPDKNTKKHPHEQPLQCASIGCSRPATRICNTLPFAGTGGSAPGEP